MPPRFAAHEFIKSVLGMALLRWAPDEVIVAVASTLQLANDILIEPDIAILPESVYAGDPKSYAQPGPEGVPLLIEIAVSSMAYDRDFKARLYAHLGIRELWVIDATERVTWIYTAPSGDTWRSVIERGPKDALTTPSLPGFSICLGDIA